MTSQAVVLVHSPFVGASCWLQVARVLADRGHAAVVPSLAAAFSGSPPYYRSAAQAVVRSAGSFDEIMLVVHSGAGGLVDAICDAATVSEILFVDAVLPFPDRSWASTLPPKLKDRLFALARSGFLPTWDQWFGSGALEGLMPDPEKRTAFAAELPRIPLAFAHEVAPTESTKRPKRFGYLRLSDGYEQEARIAEGWGWPTARRSLHHLAPLTDPEGVAEELEGLMAKARARSA
ncbi:MAG: alpha/beta hydrolase [Alphaproteobacteria bacterium]|nr:alpha/beta hydrolase [Alphaproteobacteria bacterium]